jgi:hypothetical protein
MMLVRRPWFDATIAVLAVVCLLAGTASADITVKGDQAAWQEVQAAYGKLKALAGYRMKMDTPGASMMMEVASGGTAMHMIMRSAQGSVESYFVNGQIRVKNDMPDAQPGWHCSGAPSAAMAGPPDPTKIQGTVDISRGQDTTIDGEPMHVFTYTFETRGRASRQTLYVGAANGLPRRIAVATPRGDQTMDYYDYGAAIQFNLPACT